MYDSCLQVCILCYKFTAAVLLFTQLVHDRCSSDAAAHDTFRRPSCRRPTSDVLWTRLNSIDRLGLKQPVPTTLSDSDEISPYIDGNDGEPLDADVSNEQHVTSRLVRHSRKRPRSFRKRSINMTGSTNVERTADIDIDSNAQIRPPNIGVRRHGNDSDVIGDVISRRLGRHANVDVRLSARTSWHCGVEKYWKRMSGDVYPTYVQTGRCIMSTCMLGLYECRPVKYAINVLRRNISGQHRCVPLPTTNSTETTYEQAWTLSHIKVTVACQCSNKRTARRQSASPPIP